MSWEEISDEAREKTIVVPKNSVMLRTYHRKYQTKTHHYLFNVLIGSTVFKKLKWTPNTVVKFQWGKAENLGLLRISVIINNAEGWTPKIYKKGYVMISNKALPENVNKTTRDVELIYSVMEDSRNKDLFFLEIMLPEDFYIDNARGDVVNAMITSNITKENKSSNAIIQSANEPVVLPSLQKQDLNSGTNTNHKTSVDDEFKISYDFKKGSRVLTEESPTTTLKSNNSLEPKKSNLPPEKPKIIPPVNVPVLPEEKTGPLTVYDRAILNGGPLNIDGICKYLKIYIGHAASRINGTQVDIDGNIISFSETVKYANECRTKSGKPIFSLSP